MSRAKRGPFLICFLSTLSFTPTTSNSSGAGAGSGRITHADLVEHLSNISNPESRGGTFNRSSSFIAQPMVRLIELNLAVGLS